MEQPPPCSMSSAAAASACSSSSVKKSGDFSKWYSQVITQSEMIDYYDVSGCYILRPWAFSIWENIQKFFDSHIKSLGVQNAYFPLFVPRCALEKEKDHVEGFAPEVAWVTRSGHSELPEPMAIRPTSETIMYPAYARWIRSHRDLPLKLNQWTNVVRWEFKHPTPFIRTREFLWQEGHSAFATKAEADEEVFTILDLYARVYEELLAVPVIKGRKSEQEKFAGGHYTTTVEAFVPAVGRAIQGATSHCLGQNFARIFDISFESDSIDPATGKPRREMVWQNSWGLTTRTIGVMVMVHGDDKGLVLPPRVAPIQVVFVWIWKSSTPEDVKQALFTTTRRLAAALNEAGLRAKVDDREIHKPGWKYNHWEQKGVPLRVEIGPDDMETGTVMVARRDQLGGPKLRLPADEASFVPAIAQLLDRVHDDMLARARRERDERLVFADNWADFMRALNNRCMAIAPWCQRIECEKAANIRSAEDSVAFQAGVRAAEGQTAACSVQTSSAKTLCIPCAQAQMPPGTPCFCCGSEATVFAMWGRSY